MDESPVLPAGDRYSRSSGGSHRLLFQNYSPRDGERLRCARSYFAFGANAPAPPVCPLRVIA